MAQEEQKFEGFNFSASSQDFTPEEFSYNGEFPVRPVDVEFFSGVYGNLNVLFNKQIHCFSIHDKQWTSYSQVDDQEITVFPKYCSVVDFGRAQNFFYISGGLGARLTAMDESYKIEIKTTTQREQNIEQLPSMQQGRYLHQMARIGDTIYAFGGQSDPQTYLNSAEVYRDGQWHLISPMHRPRSNFAVATFRNFIYVFGGYSGNNQLNDTIEKYNSDTNSWEVVNFDPNLQILVGVLILESPEDPTKLWLIGGSDGEKPSAQILEFNLSDDSLVDSGKTLKYPRAKAMGCSLYEDLYVFGGGVNDSERFEGGNWISYRGFPQLNEFEAVAASWFKR